MSNTRRVPLLALESVMYHEMLHLRAAVVVVPRHHSVNVIACDQAADADNEAADWRPPHPVNGHVFLKQVLGSINGKRE